MHHRTRKQPPWILSAQGHVLALSPTHGSDRLLAAVVAIPGGAACLDCGWSRGRPIAESCTTLALGVDGDGWRLAGGRLRLVDDTDPLAPVAAHYRRWRIAHREDHAGAAAAIRGRYALTMPGLPPVIGPAGLGMSIIPLR